MSWLVLLPKNADKGLQSSLGFGSAFSIHEEGSCLPAIEMRECELRPALLAGHVVAVRVTSEEANDGFKPTCGSIDELSFRTSPDVWGYFSVKSGGGIHEFSDSQVGTKDAVQQRPLHGVLCSCDRALIQLCLMQN